MAVAQKRTKAFYGWRVVGAAFVLAAFGWGMGFYGPPIFLRVLGQTRGWPLALISTAVTMHFLAGAISGASLSVLYRRFGAATVTKAAAVSLGVGIVGWAMAQAPWQLFIAVLFSGVGWSAMSAAAVNAIVAPWFERTRPAALAMAYNGGSVGGIVFSPLWVGAIAALGFPIAAATIGIVMALTIWTLADLVFSRTPGEMGLAPDGDAPEAGPVRVTASAAHALPGALLWRNAGFRTLAAGMALGLFAQIGLMAHLYSLLVPALGAQLAGWALSLMTVMAIAGRTLVGWIMPAGADRRLVACGGYGCQLLGSLVLMAAGGANVPLLVLGVVLFGAGFGNATSLPPLVAQIEFAAEDVARVVPLIVAMAQAAYAFAPAAFGLIRELTAADAHPGAAPALFATAALVQGLALCAFLAGRR